jgi:hypothetical protein
MSNFNAHVQCYLLVCMDIKLDLSLLYALRVRDKAALRSTIEADKNDTTRKSANYIMWHVDTLLGNDRKISNYTTAVTSTRPVNSKRGKVFSTRSVPRCYKQD